MSFALRTKQERWSGWNSRAAIQGNQTPPNPDATIGNRQWIKCWRLDGLRKVKCFALSAMKDDAG